jgi:hypothetical protein
MRPQGPKLVRSSSAYVLSSSVAYRLPVARLARSTVSSSRRLVTAYVGISAA